jgi:hypothetical protein
VSSPSGTSKKGVQHVRVAGKALAGLRYSGVLEARNEIIRGSIFRMPRAADQLTNLFTSMSISRPEHCTSGDTGGLFTPRRHFQILPLPHGATTVTA